MNINGGIIRGGALAMWLALFGAPAWAQGETSTQSSSADTQSEQQASDAQASDTKDQKARKDKKSSDSTDSSSSSDTSSSQDQGGDSTSKAREALKQKKGDVTQEKNLEQVFQASEKQYSLLKSGDMSFQFSGSYTYYRNDQIDSGYDPSSGKLTYFRILHDAEHSFGSSLSMDYGIWDNLTFNTTLPVVYKYDTQKNVSKAALGDVTLGLRYQPFPTESGATNTTLYTTFSTATGDSPYKIDPTREVASGKGYYALGAGLSASKVLDPVVLFGSLGYTYAFDATGLDQRRGSRTLTTVHTGDSINFSFGLAYSLSYEVSFSGSYQQSYNFPTDFVFKNGDVAHSQDSTSSVVNMSLGLRSASDRIVNVSFGFGLTSDSPDVLLGFSVPLDVTGMKSGS